MKKITLLMFALLVSTITFAQTPIITMISDGDCSGGTPKVVEIYADGTVDFSEYTLQNQTNSNNTWGSNFDLSNFGTVTDDFVYVYYSSGNGSTGNEFAQEYPNATSAEESSTLNINGDDRIRIIHTNTSSIIDIYGVDSLSGTGEAWEYKDGYAKRNSGTTASATFNTSDWTFNNGALDGEGTCQGGSTFASIIGIGDFTPGTTSCPLTISITDISCDNITTGTDTYTVTGTFSGGGTETYSFTINAGTITSPDHPDTMATGSIIVTGIPEGTDLTYTITSSNCNISNTIPSPDCEPISEVLNIGELREGTIGETYTLTGEAVITYARDATGRNQKYIQDETDGEVSGILLDDPDGVITGTYAIGDVISNITGELVDYNGVLELVPIQDISGAISTGNNITPQIISVPDFNADPNAYESELIAFENISFTDADGTVTFSSNPVNYEFQDANSEVAVFRTNFSEAGYIDQVIPTGVINLVGLGSEYNGTAQLFARDSDDIDATLATERIAQDIFSVYPNPASNGFINISTVSNETASVAIFNILGKQVLSKELNGEAINVSGLQSGVYLIKVTQKGKSTTKKLVIK